MFWCGTSEKYKVLVSNYLLRFFLTTKHDFEFLNFKKKSPKGSRVTVQIEQYLLCSAVRLKSCSSPAAAASWLTSSMLPHVSLAASQLLKPASTTQRSYGRRNRSWLYEPQAQINC